jgi:AraC-like DNA-binding protein
MLTGWSTFLIPIESFSTAGMEPRRKLAFWNDRVSESLTPLVSEPLDVRDFNGSISQVSIDDMSLAEVYSDAQIVHHSRYHVSRTKQPTIFLQLQLEGDSITRQDGRESILHAGDFALLDSTRRYDITFTGSNRMLVLSIPDRTLRRQVGCPESLAAVPMSCDRGANKLLSQLLRGYWREYCRGLERHMGSRILGVILDLIAAAYADLPQAMADRSSLGTAHRIRILNYIHAHLHDPELTPTRIAEACRITTRYLHLVFSDQEETVARYILRRRLEECARALQSSAHRSRSVTAIAFDHGFNSPTHFGRVFRDKFKMTPREFRSEAGIA